MERTPGGGVLPPMGRTPGGGVSPHHGGEVFENCPPMVGGKFFGEENIARDSPPQAKIFRVFERKYTSEMHFCKGIRAFQK